MIGQIFGTGKSNLALWIADKQKFHRKFMVNPKSHDEILKSLCKNLDNLVTEDINVKSIRENLNVIRIPVKNH